MLDVGVRVLAGEENIERFRVALPARTRGKVEDLSARVLNPTNAALIFDAEVSIGRNSVVELESSELHVVGIRRVDCNQDVGSASRDFSLWTIVPADPIPAGESRYLRFRFDISSAGRTWQWQRQLFGRVGAIVDFRISDVRGTATAPGGEGLLNKIRPIGRATVFVTQSTSESEPLVRPVARGHCVGRLSQ